MADRLWPGNSGSFTMMWRCRVRLAASKWIWVMVIASLTLIGSWDWRLFAKLDTMVR